MKSLERSKQNTYILKSILLLFTLMIMLASCDQSIDYTSNYHDVSFSHAPEWQVAESNTEITLSRNKGGMAQEIKLLFDSPEVSAVDDIVEELEGYVKISSLREQKDLIQLEEPHTVSHPRYQLAQTCFVLTAPVNYDDAIAPLAESDQLPLELPMGIEISLLSDNNRSIIVTFYWLGYCDDKYGNSFRKDEKEIIQTLLLE